MCTILDDLLMTARSIMQVQQIPIRPFEIGPPLPRLVHDAGLNDTPTQASFSLNNKSYASRPVPGTPYVTVVGYEDPVIKVNSMLYQRIENNQLTSDYDRSILVHEFTHFLEVRDLIEHPNGQTDERYPRFQNSPDYFTNPSERDALIVQAIFCYRNNPPVTVCLSPEERVEIGSQFLAKYTSGDFIFNMETIYPDQADGSY